MFRVATLPSRSRTSSGNRCPRKKSIGINCACPFFLSKIGYRKHGYLWSISLGRTEFSIGFILQQQRKQVSYPYAVSPGPATKEASSSHNLGKARSISVAAALKIAEGRHMNLDDAPQRPRSVDRTDAAIAGLLHRGLKKLREIINSGE
jgi:hypothetical protein